MLLLNPVFAQPNEGAIKTSAGFLLYSNSGINSYTLYLEGDIDLTNYPFIKQNGIWFQFHNASKADFGESSKKQLTNYMEWEVNWLEKQMNTKINKANEFSNKNTLMVNFWKYENPVVNDKRIHTPTKATYFLDFISKDLIYRLSYASTSGNDSEAKTILFGIFDNFRFYEKSIDLDKLQKNILKGQNFYHE
ncbi:MAG: hypothetical protein LC127_13215 [Chitinophagales bacterium]|nr:hypothetical protein [Chitinophagales bacterium]